MDTKTPHFSASSLAATLVKHLLTISSLRPHSKCGWESTLEHVGTCWNEVKQARKGVPHATVALPNVLDTGDSCGDAR